MCILTTLAPSSLQLAAMEQIGGGGGGGPCDVERGRAFGNLGTCYDSLGDYEEGVKVSRTFK